MQDLFVHLDSPVDTCRRTHLPVGLRFVRENGVSVSVNAEKFVINPHSSVMVLCTAWMLARDRHTLVVVLLVA